MRSRFVIERPWTIKDHFDAVTDVAVVIFERRRYSGRKLKIERVLIMTGCQEETFTICIKRESKIVRRKMYDHTASIDGTVRRVYLALKDEFSRGNIARVK